MTPSGTATIDITARDKTRAALMSAQRGLQGFAEATNRAHGGLDRFLALSPKFLLLGAAGAVVAGSLRGLYKNSEELQSGTKRLSESWNLLLDRFADSAAVKAAAAGLDAIAHGLERMAQSGLDTKYATDDVFNYYQSKLDGFNAELKKTYEQKTTRANYGILTPWIPSNDVLDARIVELKKKIEDYTSDLNRYVSTRDIKAVAPKIDEKQLERELEPEREKSKKLAALYASAYEATRTPQEQFIERTKEAGELLRVYGAQAKDLYGRIVADARDKLLSTIEAAEKAAEKLKERPRSLADYGEFDTIEDEDAQVTAFQRSTAALEGEAAYRNERILQFQQDLEQQLTDESERGKQARLAIAEEEYRNRQSFAQSTASLLGSLASLADGKSRRQFQIAKALSRAQTIVNTASMAISAGRDTPGPWPVKAAAVAAALAAGAAQLKRINTASYGGGGDTSGGSVAAGAATPVNQVPTIPTQQQTAPNNITIYIDGIATEDVVRNTIVPILQDSINNADVTIIGARSRQAAIIRGA